MRFVPDTDLAMPRRRAGFKFWCLTPSGIELITTLMENGGAGGDESGHP